jgi:hypothetical protein
MCCVQTRRARPRRVFEAEKLRTYQTQVLSRQAHSHPTLKLQMLSMSHSYPGSKPLTALI